MKERLRENERARTRESFNLLVHSPVGWDWCRPKLGYRNSIWVSHLGGWAPVSWAVRGPLVGIRSSCWDSNQCLDTQCWHFKPGLHLLHSNNGVYSPFESFLFHTLASPLPVLPCLGPFQVPTPVPAP